jgi:hypothetical protein
MGVKEEKKALSEPGPSGFVWRPQGDSLRHRSGQAHPCYPDEARDALGRKKGPERIRASRICLASPRGFEPLLPT